MAEKLFCSRETVLNFLLDRYKTTYADVASQTEGSDPNETIRLMEDSMEHFCLIDTEFEDRVKWVLDRICEYYDAEASYFLIYGRTRNIYLSSFFEASSDGRKIMPSPEEFSLLLFNRLKNEFKPGRLCFLKDVEYIKEESKEIYAKMINVGIKNEIFMPVFSYGNVVGFITIYNIHGKFGNFSAVQHVMNTIATIGYEVETTKFKGMELSRRLVGESKDSYRAEMEKKDREVRFANEITRRLGQRFRRTYVIDLNTENYAENINNSFSTWKNREKGNAGEDFEYMVNELAHVEFKVGLRRFLELADLGVRLSERDEISFEYIDNDDHWCKCSFLALDREKNGLALKVLYTEEMIDNEKSGSTEKMHFMRTVSDSYIAVYRFDLVSEDFVAIKPFEIDIRLEMFSNNLQQMMNIWTAEFLYPEATDEERAFFDMSTLTERLKNGGRTGIDLNTTRLGWVRIEFITYSHGINGEPKSVLWTVKDIIEKKRYEALTDATSETYKVLAYASLPHNRYKTLIYSRKTAKYLPDEGTLETALGIMRLNVSQDHIKRVMDFVSLNNIRETLKDEKTMSMDYLNPDGKWVKVSITRMSMDSNGRPADIVFSIQMIDEAKRKELEKEAAVEWAYEEAKQANATKAGFFSNLSHDIRTPMNAIVGMTRIALDNMDNMDRVEDCLEKIKGSADHLLALINDSLDLSRIESGKIVISHDPVNLREMENNFMSIMQGYMVDRRLEIITDCQPPAVECVLTDGLRLRQVVLNILSNAVKYTPDGKNIIYRSENRLSEDGKKLHIKFTIADSGIGMTPEFLQRIYEPFSQAEREGPNSNYKGTGLGMVIVKSFVDMLGGTIEIQSEVNVGTIVTLNFDFDVDTSPVVHKEEFIEEKHKNIELKNTKIMLVEDNDINREIAVELLKSMNMDITEAVDGEDAVYKFRASALGEYKCIFMDIMMPLMNGYEATRAIRDMDRDDAKTVPIIAMSANAFMEDVKMSKECGMNDHIPKPIDPEYVKEIVERYLTK